MRTTGIIGLVAALLVLGWILHSPAEGSGTYRRPGTPKRPGVEEKRFERGKQLFASAEFAGDEGKACSSCHDGKKPAHELRRSRLNRRGAKLLDTVNRCRTLPERGAGATLVGGEEDTIALGVYLAKRFRLHPTRTTAFETPPEEKENSRDDRAKKQP